MNISHLLLFAALIVFILRPVKFKATQDRAMYLGFVVAVVINLHFNFHSPAESGRSNDWYMPIAFYMPTVLVLPLAIVVFVCRGVLRGSVSPQRWDISEAKTVLTKDASIFRRALARTYIAASPLMWFLLGWAIVSLIFNKLLFTHL